jgi:RHS repeat-associated protein
VTNYYNTFRTNCQRLANESLTYSYVPKEFHYTLYYYDQAGNLVQTVPPQGVKPLTAAQVNAYPTTKVNPAHELITLYQYNSLNQLLYQKTPDAGESRFWYNDKSQLKLSQNARQFNDNNYSYTKYDEQGRIKEVGEMATTNVLDTLVNKLEDQDFPASGLPDFQLTDITRTHYDFANATIQPTFYQQQLRNRVAWVEVLDKNKNDVAATYYSYDIHGNVKSLLQQIPDLATKRTDYVYDLVSGKVNFVMYQYGERDQFIHRYDYDADNRIVDVLSSTDGFLWDKEAAYQYYLHGPMARMELGEYRVQGSDYYYTLQGWLKGVNSPTGVSAQANDPGKDGFATSTVARDVYAYNLGYYQGDYKPAGGTISALIENSSPLLWRGVGGEANSLFNGNIAWMATDLAAIPSAKANRNAGLQAMQYNYDQLHRIVRSRSLGGFNESTGLTARTATPAAYDEDYTYDANGNILTLQRRNELAALQDDFNYIYYKGTNKLRSILPPTTVDTVYTGAVNSNRKIYRKITVTGNAYVPDGADVVLHAEDSVMIHPIFNKANGKSFRAYAGADGPYQYDAIGNLIADETEGVKISWTPYGKVREVKTKNDSIVVSYRYDVAGNRIEKRISSLSPGEGRGEVTHYLRDASGNVMAIYKTPLSGGEGAGGEALIEQPLYGSSRLGMYKGGRKEGQRILGKKNYELTNHLGNVLSVITDNAGMKPDSVWATVISATDYYPFGLAMKGRTFSDTTYRYGFNGKEKDAMGDAVYDYGFRIYNPRIAKFLSVDPLASSYPWWSTYAFAGNTPIQAIDLDGLEIYYSQSGEKIGTYSASTEIRVVNNDQLATATTEFATYNTALKTDPAATNEFLGGTLTTTGSVKFADYFTAVSDVLNNATLSAYSKVNGVVKCDCACAAKGQMKSAGVTLSGQAINTLVDNTLQQPPRAQLGEANPIGGMIYTQTQLNAGNPVLVGVQEAKAGETTPQDPGNTNHTTGHFIVIVGTNVSETGEISFRYYDNATYANGKKEENKLVMDSSTGIAEDSTPANTNKAYYKISEVRKNKE